MVTVQKVTSREVERALIAGSFLDFWDRVKIEEGGGAIPFLKWPHLLFLAEVLQGHQLVILGKARQIGATWLVAAWVLWRVMYQENAYWLLLSKGEKDARDLLARCAFIWKRLPEHLRTERTNDSTERMDFVGESRIVAMPSSADAGRGGAPTGVVMDEADFHPYFEESYVSLKPPLDANGGQMILLSTSNRRLMNSRFKSILRGARMVEYVA